MNILLIDTSSKKIEFAYNQNGDFTILETLGEDNNADLLVFNIRKKFIENNIDFKTVEYIGLSNGPGSFTGLRVGSAISKGICFTLGCKLVEIVTLDIIAEKYDYINENRNIVPLIFSNSRTGDYYTARYKYEKGLIKRISDYYIASPEIELNKEINFKINAVFLVNEKTEFVFPDKIDIVDLSGRTNMTAMLKITKEKIAKGEISDFRTSEPFYMKDFVPNV